MNELSFPEITDYLDARLSFNLLAKRGALRCTWTAKNMCTSLKFAFAEFEGIVTAEVLPQFLENPKWIHNWVWPLEPKGALALREPAAVAFFVLRNPATRLSSALVEKVIYQDEDFERIVAPALAYFSGYVRKSVENMTFDDLLLFIQWAPDRMLDQHFFSQTSALSGQYSHCFQFERPGLIADFLAGQGLTLRKISPHSRNEQVSDEFPVRLGSKIADVRRACRSSAGVWFTPDAQMRSRIEELVQSRFRNDLALWSMARVKGGCIER